MEDNAVKRARRSIVTVFFGLLSATAVLSSPAISDDQSSSLSVPAPRTPAGLAKRASEIIDAVLDHHIDPPTRQQMILDGVKAVYQGAGLPVPSGLGRRVSSLTTSEQLPALLGELWPSHLDKPVAAEMLEDYFLQGLFGSALGGGYLETEKERKVSEQAAGNRYVGIHIALGTDDQQKRPKIFEVFEGGPADRTGVKKDDFLEQIDGVDTKGMTLREAVDRLRGAEGTSVTIKVRQPNASASRTLTITRGQHPRTTVSGISKRSTGGWEVRLPCSDPIGYLRISEIVGSTPHELRKMAEQLESEGARGLVLDLRGAQSWAVHPAVLLADSLLGHGVIGRVRTARGETTYQADGDALFRNWPMVVLINSPTGGTVEWLTAALMDNHRATVIGTSTLSAPARRSAEAGIRSSIPIGDGSRSVVLVTGCLERGNGQPLSELDQSAVATRLPRGSANFGVKPDHVIPANTLGPVMIQANESRSPQPETKSDPVVHKAIELLQDALRRRDS
jgi:carboxyl-terminal processing protease